MRRRRRSHVGSDNWLTTYADLITNLLIFFTLFITASKIQTGRMEQIIRAISNNEEMDSLVTAEMKIKEKIKEEQLEQSVRVEMTDEGLELAFDSGVVFPSGSAQILPEMQEPLSKVLNVLLPYSKKYKLAIEGHTDERPMRGALFKTNWELSSGRALVLREELEKIGVDQNKIRVEAYADTKPLPVEQVQGLDRETNLAKHRRVVIRLF